MKGKNKALKSFQILVKYLKEERGMNNKILEKDFSLFLNHAIHIKAYDFVSSFCKNKRVLDVGCFIGYGEEYLCPQAKEVIAIDKDEKALEIAKKYFSFPNVKFQKVIVNSTLPFVNDSFDIVVAFQFIEHLPPQKLKTFFQEIQRILKADGLFFLTTPNRKFRLRPFQLPFNLEHYKEFTAKELLQILVPIFNDVKIHGIRGKEWIEKIEKERLQISFFKAYFYYPFARFVYKVFPNFPYF